MTLDEWRLHRSLTYRELGKLIGCPVGMAYAYCLEPQATESRLPGFDRMRRIHEISSGQVTPNDFYDLPSLPASPIEEAA